VKIIHINSLCRCIKMTNEEIIWSYLYSKIKNPYGVAALIGNLFAESSLNPINANNVKKKLGLTNEEYTAVIDSRKNDNFITDGIAYGLAQWRYSTRKQGLLLLARQQNKSIGDLNLQLEYLWQELQKYKTVLNTLCTAKNIKEASDIVLLRYEKPANTSDKVKHKRASYGQKYFDKYYSVSNIAVNVSMNALEELKKQLGDILK